MIQMMKYRCCQRFTFFPCSYFVSAKVTTGLMNNLFLMDSVHHHFGPTWPTQDSNPGSSCCKATNHCANAKIQKYAFKNISTPLFFWMTTNANCWLSHQQATLTDSAVSGGIWLVCFECGKKVFICTVKYWKGRHTQFYWHYWCYWDYLQFLCFIINQRFINCITYRNIPGNLVNDQLNGTLYFLFLSIVHLWCWVDLVDDRVESWLLDWAHLIRSSLPVTTPVRQTTPWL